MSITINGIRLTAITIPDQSKEDRKIQGSYVLISSDDKILATQPFNTYSAMDVSPSPATIQAQNAFLASLKADISALLGLS